MPAKHGIMYNATHSVATWLDIDLDAVEEQLFEGMKLAQDKTRTEILALNYQLELNSLEHYLCQDNILPGDYQCTTCEHSFHIPYPGELEACHKCSGHHFNKQSTH